ncbi:MAG: tRNA (N(6)-L-threonylcarbamoyladenosine(37)-C(2))-methylthiotransferase [Archaeoglobaceae archaeon]
MVKVHIETYGCTMNQADSDLMRGIISQKHQIAEEGEQDADIVVLNTCGVIEFTERKILRRIEELKPDKKVVVAGCLPKISREKVREISDVVVGTNVYDIDKAIECAVKGENASFVDKADADKAGLCSLKRRLENNAIAIVSISEGCLGHCTFCATRRARGRLKSFSIENIEKEIEGAVEQGFKEIQLTSQDTGAYGLDKNKFSLPDLLSAISEIEGDFRVRVGMMNPEHALNNVEELVNAFKSEKIYKFLHVPVQSGDNKILEDMGRDHSPEDFRHLVSHFRKSFKDVMVSTDIIVGFPTEDEGSFYKSYELIKEVEPQIVNITRYSPRHGTSSYRLKDIPDWIKKERSRKLTRLCKQISYSTNRRFLGSEQKVLATRNGKNGTILTRTNSYRPVILQKAEIGEFYDVKIADFAENYLVGQVV